MAIKQSHIIAFTFLTLAIKTSLFQESKNCKEIKFVENEAQHHQIKYHWVPLVMISYMTNLIVKIKVLKNK